MANIFSPALQQKIQAYLSRYETKRSAILPVLHAIQDELGWVEDKHMDALHSEYGLDRIDVREVYTFYTAYHKERPRKFHIQFCDNIVCCMMGAKDVMHKIEGHIKKYEEKVGDDAPFGMIGVPCLGVCDGAPAMLVNKDRYLKVTNENVDQILQKYAPLP